MEPWSGEPLPGRVRAAWIARLNVPQAPPLLPVWFGGPERPGRDARPYVLGVALARWGGTADVHAHVGRLNGQEYAPQLMDDLLAEAHVASAWVSNLDGASASQADANRRVLELVRGRPALVPVFWANPVEGMDPALERLLEEGGFAGLKFHPELNGYCADDAALDPYLERAAARGMFALFHTDRADRSRPERLARLAARHPRVRFIAGHMGLWGAQEEALRAIREAPAANIFGDLAWFHRFDLLAGEIEAGRTERFVFGSDAPVDGEESYQQYLWILLRMSADEDILRALFVDNPRRLLTGRG
jgi:predicted TIM-barrel fold metal-dependent hydrolase